ncbi:NADH:flavin oxidoreductase [Bacillaceae bacterium S4-13-56]
MNNKYDSILEKISLPNGIVLKNRLGTAPMSTYSSNPDGSISDQELNYYKRRANLGDLFISGCIAVSKSGLLNSKQFIAYEESVNDRLKKMAISMKSFGSKAILQINHAGRRAMGTHEKFGEVLAPSSVEYPSLDELPKELSEMQIKEIIKDFGNATKKAIHLGFDGVEIHGANHYLIQQFFSTYSNQRKDEWGGSLQKRMRFPLAVLEEVQKVVKQEGKDTFIVGYRLSPEEVLDKTIGYTIDETLEMVEKLIENRIHYIHSSLYGGVDKVALTGNKRSPVNSMIYNKINKRVPFVVGSNIFTPADAMKALEYGDIVVLGREAILDPEWLLKLTQERVEEIATHVPVDAPGSLDIPQGMWAQLIDDSNTLPPLPVKE